MTDTIFHSGEEFIQEQSGEKGMAQRNGGIISNQLSSGAINFVLSQKIFFASTQDVQGNLWASVLSGSNGFLKPEKAQQLILNQEVSTSNEDDVFWQNISDTPGIGLLFIDLMSRRRFRINGHIMPEEGHWRMQIRQAYPNCPKYIQRRQLTNEPARSSSIQDLHSWISTADTIFVASADKEGNLDVSHRGGNSGFVKIVDEQTLRIPDYVGNSMFNTLGNFHVNPAAGILIVDFSNGETLQLSGKALVHLNDSSTEVYTGGTRRFWDFKIEKIVYSRSLPHFSSRFIDFSPFNP
jgi:predicted pyridoxine 5'-phosphate oxidase superfamily flavin-nucleotide-binding protein